MPSNDDFRDGFSHEVGPELAKLIPEEIISDESRRREHVDRALDFGLKALAQATLGIETSFVEETFRSLAAGLEDDFEARYLGEDSALSRSIRILFEDPSSPFRMTLNLENEESPLAQFLARLEKKDGERHDALEKDIEFLKRRLTFEEGKAEEATVGTRKGSVFEEDIANYLDKTQFNDSFDPCGTKEAAGTGSKKGDVLAELEGGSQRIVLEAKSGQNYSKEDLKDQLDKAMDIREGDGAIAVTTTKAMESKGWQEPFMEVGNNRYIVAVDWDGAPGWTGGSSDFSLLYVTYAYVRTRLLQGASSSQGGTGVDTERLRDLIVDLGGKLKKCKRIRSNLTNAKTSIGTSYELVGELRRDVEEQIGEIERLLEAAEEEPGGPEASDSRAA